MKQVHKDNFFTGGFVTPVEQWKSFFRDYLVTILKALILTSKKRIFSLIHNKIKIGLILSSRGYK